MKLNIFEGARRISLLIGAIWVVGCLSFAIFSEPDSRVTYQIPSLSMAPILLSTCDYDDATEFIERQTNDGQTVKFKLCFKAHMSDNGRKMVPYVAGEKNITWMGTAYSAEVRNYTKAFAEQFQPSEEGIKAAKEKHTAALLDQWKNALMVLVAGLAGGWVFTKVTGWIVRGFLGIERGHDMRASV